MPIRDEHRYFSKFRLQFDAPISIRRAPDFYSRRLRIIRYEFSVRETQKAAQESLHRISGNVNTIFRDHLKARIRRCGRMPVELCVNATRPLDDRMSSDWIVARTDEYIRSGDA